MAQDDIAHFRSGSNIQEEKIQETEDAILYWAGTIYSTVIGTNLFAVNLR